MSSFKIVALLISGAVVGITIANAVYFNRLYKSIKHSSAATRNTLYGSNALTNAQVMWWINLILAILASLFFVYALFKIAGVGEADKVTVKTTANTIVLPVQG